MELNELYHHYYNDCYGISPPIPDPTNFEPVHFLTQTSDFRFKGRGLGESPTTKANRSNELGQAFCRWFLHKHLDFIYFAHIGRVINRVNSGISNFRVERIGTGDAPDYLCASASNEVCLAEAKGRSSPVKFDSPDFVKWRDQFSRVSVKGHDGIERKTKGHIIATQLASERGKAKQSEIFAEDPFTPGETLLDQGTSSAMREVVVTLHYSDIMTKIAQPVLAASLAGGVGLPKGAQIDGFVWEMIAGPLAGRCFVGGYFLPACMPPYSWYYLEDLLIQRRLRRSPVLNSAQVMFYGLEESVFSRLVNYSRDARSSRGFFWDVFEQKTSFYDGLSALKDGSILGPLELFSLKELKEF